MTTISPQNNPSSKWQPSANWAQDKVNNALEDKAKPFMTAVVKGARVDGFHERIQALDSAGDKAVMAFSSNAMAETAALNLVPPARAAALAAKLQTLKNNGYGLDVNLNVQSTHSIEVKRNSDMAQSSYTVSYSKTSWVGGGAELASKDVKMPIPRTPADFDASARGFLRGSASGGFVNTVEFTFDSKAQAQRAAAILEKLASADMVDDALRTTIAAHAAVFKNPLPLVAGSLALEGSANNMANPMSEYGEVNPGLRRAAGVSDADMRFLASRISAQEAGQVSDVRANVELRGSVVGKGTPSPATLNFPGVGSVPMPALEIKPGMAIDGRLDSFKWDIRRVEYPTQFKPGAIVDKQVYTDQLTVRWRDIAQGALKGASGVAKDGVTVQTRDDQVFELYNATTTFKRTSPVNAGTQLEMKDVMTWRPESSGVEVESTVMRANPQGLAKLEGGALLKAIGQRSDGKVLPDQWLDMNRTRVNYSVTGRNAALLQWRADKFPFLRGELGFATQNLRDGALTSSADRLDREGTNNWSTGRLAMFGLLNLEAGQGKMVRIDDVAKGKAPAKPETPRAAPLPPVPSVRVEPQISRWQVQPYAGVNVRATPQVDGERNKIAIVQSGSYLDSTGITRQDAQGNTWLKIKGRDQRDVVVEGWVRQDLLQPYDKTQGNNDETGRVNPSRAGTRKVAVEDGDNLWLLAQRSGVPFAKALQANPHLLDPALVFKGDTLYMPLR